MNKCFRWKGEFESTHRTLATVISFIATYATAGTDFSAAFTSCRQHIANVASHDPEMNCEILFLTAGGGICGNREASALLASYGSKVRRCTSFIDDFPSENQQVSPLNKTFGDTIGSENMCCRLVSPQGQQTDVRMSLWLSRSAQVVNPCF